MSGDGPDGGIGVVILAAGAGSRFGGGKLLADLEGRPMLQHVLDAARVASPLSRVVVLGDDAPAVEARLDWHDEVRVVNPTPGAGLSGSLRLGVATCLGVQADLTGILVVLGDQPRTSVEVMRVLMEAAPAAAATGAWAVMPRYALGGGPNPAVLLREALARVPDLEGDQGMGSLLRGEPGRVRWVDVPGENPDVDTRADLAALADRSR